MQSFPVPEHRKPSGTENETRVFAFDWSTPAEGRDWPIVCDPRISGQPSEGSIRPIDVVVSRHSHSADYHRLVARTQQCPLLRLEPRTDEPNFRTLGRDTGERFGRSVQISSTGRFNFDGSSCLDTITPCIVDFQRSRLAITDRSYPSSAWASLGSTEKSGEVNVATIHVAGRNMDESNITVRAGRNAFDVGLHLSRSSADLAIVSPDHVLVHLFGQKPDWAHQILATESRAEQLIRISSRRGNSEHIALERALHCGAIVLGGAILGVSAALYMFWLKISSKSVAM